MIITLDKVKARRYSKQQIEVIQQIFLKGEHECIIILGYSCSDEYDIPPQIEDLKNSNIKIFLIEHMPE